MGKKRNLHKIFTNFYISYHFHSISGCTGDFEWFVYMYRIYFTTFLEQAGSTARAVCMGSSTR